MSQQEPDGDATADSPTEPRHRLFIRRATELWLVAVGLWSTVGYGVRDAFSRRPAVGVIYTTVVVLGIGGAVAATAVVLQYPPLVAVGLGGLAAGGLVLASTAGSLTLDDTAHRDYRPHIVTSIPGLSPDVRPDRPSTTDTDTGDSQSSPENSTAQADDATPDPTEEHSAGGEEPEPGQNDASPGGAEQAGVGTQYVSDPPAIDFDDVAGMESVKTKLQERVIEPLREPEKYAKYGLSVENGFLLHGPPGTGKTYLSKALAGELGINYVGVKGADIISKWLGESTQNVAALFDEARQHQPCLVFIDEIDALTPERGGANQHQDQTQTVNQFLEEVSEINESDDRIVIVAATNRRDQIDPAMLRSGRLSVQIEVGNPGAKTRVAIFDTHLDAPRADDLDAKRIAEASTGLSAADMEQVATEAARSALKREDTVTNEDVETAIEELGS
ncbi:ATP-binding protein [Halonotius roseus]|uniref:ATP-binding protein n=1 Tax=Halonotius roseus TaxID=2511997 RepID=A0A544QQ55_9EURY|nr:ATP-binding protein [Halonotius roseus]TQQ81578.1 ATP-binding protein [Halonotius roseus]